MYYDLLPRIKNAYMAKKEALNAPFSKMDFEIAKVLVQAGYLKDAQKKSVGRFPSIDIKLAYKNGEPAFNDFKLISKPSRRLYSGYRTIHEVKQGHGIALFSTPQGIVNNKTARKKKVGGEYLFQIW
jgi:small subunit ribosomal protein S8